MCICRCGLRYEFGYTNCNRNRGLFGEQWIHYFANQELISKHYHQTFSEILCCGERGIVLAHHQKFYYRQKRGYLPQHCRRLRKISRKRRSRFLPHALKMILEEKGGFKSANKLIAEFYDKGYLRTRNGRYKV